MAEQDGGGRALNQNRGLGKVRQKKAEAPAETKK